MLLYQSERPRWQGIRMGHPTPEINFFAFLGHVLAMLVAPSIFSPFFRKFQKNVRKFCKIHETLQPYRCTGHLQCVFSTYQ